MSDLRNTSEPLKAMLDEHLASNEIEMDVRDPRSPHFDPGKMSPMHDARFPLDPPRLCTCPRFRWEGGDWETIHTPTCPQNENDYAGRSHEVKSVIRAWLRLALGPDGRNLTMDAPYLVFQPGIGKSLAIMLGVERDA